MARRVELELENMGFDGGWREVDGIGELKVAEHWDPWWQRADTRPEYKMMLASEYAYRVHEGTAAQMWFTNYATHTAGIRRVVEGLPVDVELVFGLWVQAWATVKSGDPHVSDGRYRARIGIGPYGGLDAESADIVWSEVVQPYDEYVHLEVRAATRSDRAALWVWGQPEWPGVNNDCYVDGGECYYLVEDEPGPGPEPEPGGEFDWEPLARGLEAMAAVLRG